jgi:hypothetical protein
MKKDDDKKGVAPQEDGELPNEKRCTNCWRLLTIYEGPDGKRILWCINCNTPR